MRLDFDLTLHCHALVLPILFNHLIRFKTIICGNSVLIIKQQRWEHLGGQYYQVNQVVGEGGV